MHKNNKHSGDYDFAALMTVEAGLNSFVHESGFGKKTIDFSDPEAVKALNTALLSLHYGVTYWEFPNANLCPPIPGRVEYIHIINDLLNLSGLKGDIDVLDIGTGATCIYPILGNAEYGWKFTGSETDQGAFENAERIVIQNKLESEIKLRLQSNPENILDGIIQPTDRWSAAMCNPPFYKDKAEATEQFQQKLKGLGKPADQNRNFSGTQKELCYAGGEKAFLHNYLYQSSLYKTNCFWYTSLVSRHALINSMEKSLEKLSATAFKILPMQLGNKMGRIVAWTFLNRTQQNEWRDKAVIKH